MSASIKYVLVWSASIAVAAAVLGLLYVLGSHTETSRAVRNVLLGSPEPYGAVIIGSSVSRSAFPPEMAGLGTAWRHPVQRYAINGVSSGKLLILAEQALALSPDLLIIEIGLSVHQRPYTPQEINSRVGRAALKVRDGTSVLFNGPAAHLTTRSEYLDLLSNPSKEPKFPKRELLNFEMNLAYWSNFLEHAREKGTKVFFITFPRPRYMAKFIPDRQYEKIRIASERLANELNAPIFKPAVYWEDQYFADTVHLNRHGRALYISQFTAWLQSR